MLSQRLLRAGKDAADVGGLAPVAAVAGMMEKAASFVPAGLRYFDSSKDQTRDRVVVLVDDLDRAAPDIIPTILWGLKEVFDLPGFSFVLFLDPDVVGAALGASHPGWGDGRLFLQKIVDFPRNIQPVTETAAVRVVVAELAALGLRVPARAIEGLRDLLPRNPRELRLFGRHLKSVVQEAERHRDRVDWPTMLRCALLDLEFPDLARSLLTSGNEIQSRRIIALARGDSAASNVRKENDATIARLCAESRILDPIAVKRGSELIRALFDQDKFWSTLSCLDQLRLLLEPPLVAPHDVESLRTVFHSSLSNWVVSIARSRGASEADVELALFRELLRTYTDAARRGLHADAAHVAGQQMLEATGLLKLVEECAARLMTVEAVRVSAFEAAWSSLFGFIGVADPQQSMLRPREQRLLTSLATASGSTALDLLGSLQPWRSTLVDPSDPEERRSFLLAVHEQLATQASSALLAVLDRDPVDEARLRSGTSVESYLIMRTGSPFWTTHRHDLIVRLQGGSDVWQHTSLTMLDLLFGDRAPWRGAGGSPATDREGLAHLWNAATSSPLNTRAFPKAERIRQALIAEGVEVPEPRWWNALRGDWRQLAARTQRAADHVETAEASATKTEDDSGGTDA